MPEELNLSQRTPWSARGRGRTPCPFWYLKPRKNWDLAYPCSAASLYHFTAVLSSCGTPIPCSYSTPRLCWAMAFPCSASGVHSRRAVAYGMGSKALVSMAWKNYRVAMTLPEAQGALEKFFAKFHTLKRWMRQHAETCNSRHRIPPSETDGLAGTISVTLRRT